jgi:peptidoglycan hydrolase-like protein with peptidoglycan-binding domain
MMKELLQLMHIRRIVSTAAVLLIAALGMALTPAAGASALGTCTGTSWHSDDAGGVVRIPTIGNDNGSFDCLLGVGNVSPAVGDLQTALNFCYGAGLSVDNNFGPLTKAALQRAQRSVAVPADGVYGPQTGTFIHWPDGSLCVPVQGFL